ncbi:MAG: STAS domain-containing protein [Burkholderiaceae bacterium]|nr:STAS domain-containing protein [Burkholderiaceae bacterium]
MSDPQTPPKEGDSFIRKVVRFVANPATDWADLNSRQDESRELDLEKSELKAMIERKKRNDFVRKREFDMLRKVRREGLSPEQLAALGGSSRLDDSESRASNHGPVRNADSGVKAKIDEIEQQMVGDNFASSSSRKPVGLFEGKTQQAAFRHTTTRAAVMARDGSDVRPAAPAPAVAAPVTPPPRNAAAAVSIGGLQGSTGSDFASPFTVEVSEVVHDPELDEAVIAFANADFDQCEQSLTALTRTGGARAQHAETWLVLFDLHRATGQQHKFEALALEYAQQFGWSAPQWHSLPKLVAESAQQEKPRELRSAGEIGWICPPLLDTDAVARLRSVTLQLPLPWVFDWSALQTVEAEAAAQLSELFRHWAPEPLDMRWLSGERFLLALQDAAPTGVRDADPAYWVLRLDALRLANRPDQFDEAAIDYCVTYEVSPPSWERARCQVRIGGSGLSTQSPPLSQVGEVATSFLESSVEEHSGAVTMASVELSGQLVGDIGATLKQLDAQLASAPLVTVACTKLIRVDFIAAGDLLNWVLAKRGESRSVTFAEAHRLVALFFGAMGINEHASVRVRNN